MAVNQRYQSRSTTVETARSMMIVDENAFPVNLGQSLREDYPETGFKVIAYNGQNVMPTALGYKSYFSNSSLFNLPPVPSTHVQHILSYQTPTYATIFLALAEEGLYFISATEGEAGLAWNLIYPSGYDPTLRIRHLWTFCVVANKLCLYQQAKGEFLVIADGAIIANLISNQPITTATVTQLYNSTEQVFGIAKVVPSFLNMAGQMGIFRADTRLGFWDSDNSVSWSSSFYIQDLTPDTTTFAGNTKFADVTGTIVKVIGQGNGFIIYSTRAVVKVVGLDGSPEKWTGSALLSDTGVVFDTHCCAAQPDDIHYALTSTGLVKITAGQMEFIETEVADYALENSPVLTLSVIDGRYLFLQTSSDLAPSNYDVEVRQVLDREGNVYLFPYPIEPESTWTYEDYLQAAMNGKLANQQEEFTYAQEPI